ncbi:MAG TPA: hypothetical protein VFL57_03700 [Bryobacteraceae bacterium]|nr:hypothetical protein [Bryobacteraceae bacterium]
MRNVVTFRIAIWASTGFVVSAAWALYFASTNKALPTEPLVYALASVTQPLAAAILYLKPVHKLTFAWIAVANAATYAVLGFIVEKAREHHRRSLQISN